MLSGLGMPDPGSLAAHRNSSSAIAWEPAGSAVEPARRTFGRFEVLRRVARCGATEVHLARRLDRHQVVALKRLRPVDRDVDAHRRALRAEGDFLLRVRHPGLCSVLETGEVEDEPFLAMEHLRGATLAALQAHALGNHDPLDARLVLSVAVHTCRVVQWLHGLHEQTEGLVGGVHQALTPAHVFITSSGAVKLLDLGAALDAPDQRLERIGLSDQRYRAPEVRDGGAADPRADVYAIGSFVLEALAAGEAPWTAGGDVDPLRRAAGFFLDRAVADDPERRFASISVLEHATMRVLGRHGGLASAAELAALVHTLVEPGRESVPEIWPRSTERDLFADATVEIPLPAELAQFDESVDEVTLLAVRAAPAQGEDQEDPLADAPLADGSGNDLPRSALVLPAPPEEPMTPRQRAKTAAARIARAVTQATAVGPAPVAPLAETPAPELVTAPASEPVAGVWRWRLGVVVASAAAAAVVAAAFVASDWVLDRLEGQPLSGAIALAAVTPRPEPAPVAIKPVELPTMEPPAEPAVDVSPFIGSGSQRTFASTAGAPVAAPAPTPAVDDGLADPWQAVRRRWQGCVDRSACGAACDGRFSILIDGSGVPYSVASSTGDLPGDVSSCMVGAARRSKDLRKLLVRMGVSEMTWSPSRTRKADAAEVTAAADAAGDADDADDADAPLPPRD